MSPLPEASWDLLAVAVADVAIDIRLAVHVRDANRNMCEIMLPYMSSGARAYFISSGVNKLIPTSAFDGGEA